MRIITLLLLFISLIGSLSAIRLQVERAYQDYFVHEVGGRVEIQSGDVTRCDILTANYVIEVDFADKRGEPTGQNLNYTLHLNKEAGIALILEVKDDYRHLIRINSIFAYHKLEIDAWTAGACKCERLLGKEQKQASATYWISSTGKTHNSIYRYYQSCKGRA